jgi:hypothetical protein
MRYYTETRLQIRQKALVAYTFTEYEKSDFRYSPLFQEKVKKLVQQETYKGELTKGAKKRLTKAIELLCQISKPHRLKNTVTGKMQWHKLSFITLTVSMSKNITAKEAYNQAFKHFLQWLRRTVKVTTYVWKAEIQKRGQIHYHITTPTFIHYQLIKDKWNNLQSKAGWLDDYFKDHGHKMPNSTDVHSVKHVNNLSGYLIKEFCKSIQNPHTTGKIWDCSENLKAYSYYTISENPHNNKCLEEIKEKAPHRIKLLEQCCIIQLKKQSLSQILDIQQLKTYDDHLQKIRTFKSLKR